MLCRKFYIYAHQKSSTPRVCGVTIGGSGIERTKFNSVLREAVTPNCCDSLTPAAPPIAKPIALSRCAKRRVLRAQGAVTLLSLSVKMRRLHKVLMQKNFRTRNCKVML
jgi:hypothetical protein